MDIVLAVRASNHDLSYFSENFKVMFKCYVALVLLSLSMSLSAREIVLKDGTADQKIKGTSLIRYTDHSTVPNYIQFMASSAPDVVNLSDWMKKNLGLSSDYNLIELNQTKDELGILHIRYRQSFKGLPIQGSMYIAHIKNDRVQSLNGVMYNDIPGLNTQAILTESNALQLALNKVQAIQYKWEVAEEEAAIKAETNNTLATYFPKAETFILKSSDGYHICYAFNIYAVEPMGRTMEYVDIRTGAIILSKNLIEHINANGTAVTKFSGVKPFQTDSVSATSFRLRDASRGLGVNTFNVNNSTNYATAVDFTDADNYWNNVNANIDEAATDAHWGAQETYDYFFNKFARNSIDNAGFQLKSYVHYNNNYVNAFWNGTQMTYGDGNISQGFMVMTALDVCGHEIAHGLTNFTADLSATSSGTAECDALNEAYSDVFGTSVERYARPTQWDWIIGGDITCTTAGVPNGVGIRSMSNPLSLGQPICYQGANWSASGEPHDNDGPLNYWFYLLTTGSALNNITAMGHDTSEKIAYRTLTVHLFPNADYADARFYSILSASELYGGCSIPVIATTNAWSTVCVGTPYVASPTVSNFTANILQTCDTSLTVTFNNTSINGTSYLWSFGDGTTSILSSPTHTYTSGIYSVKLLADGGGCGIDSLTNSAYIQVGPPAGPLTTGAIICTTGSATITATPNNVADTVRWYAAAVGGSSLATGTSYTTPVISTTTTYYAEEKITAPTYHVGPLTNAIGNGGNYNNQGRYMVFNCSAPTVLQSVWVMASGAGNRTIVLRNSAGTILQSVIVNIPNGGSVVSLNMPIPVGTGLQLGLSSPTINLYRNNAGASYPYTNGPISITGNTAANSAGYYYFFYDWVIKSGDCYSVRTPTTVTVTGGGATPASIAAPASGLTACAPSIVQLTANNGAGLTYQWYNGAAPISGATNLSYDAATSGSYSVVVSSNLGCLTPGTSTPAIVTISATPSASIAAAGATTFCQGSAVVLNANVGTGLSYQWMQNGTIITSGTSTSYTATQAGNYSVQVSNASGCSATSTSISVNVDPLPVATITAAGSTVLCQGDNVLLSATIGTGYSYQWYLNNAIIPGATSGSYAATQAGSYTVIITTLSNCTATSAGTTIIVNPSPVPVIINTAGVLSVSGGPYTSYQWNLNGAPIVGATNATYTVLQNGTYRVQVNKDGCLGTSAIITLTGVGVLDINGTSVIISPNPTQDIIHIEGILPARVIVRTLQGQLIKDVKNTSDISLSDLANGMYMMQLYDRSGTMLLNKKIVKQ